MLKIIFTKVESKYLLRIIISLEIASSIDSLELVKFLLLNGAKIGDNEYLVPNVGDLLVVSKHTALNQSFDFKEKNNNFEYFLLNIKINIYNKLVWKMNQNIYIVLIGI